MEVRATVKCHLSHGRTLVSVLLPGRTAEVEVVVPTVVIPDAQRQLGCGFRIDLLDMERHWHSERREKD